jgi:adenosylmethionine-8-amino-7-oxononanoate aminotransferase
LSAILHRNLNAIPPMAVSGEGLYLRDSEGRRYLDASGGAAVSSLGHAHPAVVAAVQRQVGKLEFAHTSFFTSEPAERLAEILLQQAPHGFESGRVAFVGSGSEAVEAALKIARQHFVEKGEPERHHFIARRMSYHGATLGALAIGGHVARRAIYQPMLMATSLVSPCYAYRFQKDTEDESAYGARLAAELATEIERLGPHTVAAFVMEPIVGATLGAVPPVRGYMRRIREVCDRYGVLLISDEVMCGMGRTGALFASADEEVTPDLITVAKGLGAGFQPIGAVLVKGSVLEPIASGSGTWAHGQTYMAHPVACAAALAVLQTILADDLLSHVKQMGSMLATRLRQVFADHPHVGDIRGRGLLWGIELVRERGTREPFAANAGLARRIKDTAQQLGLICYPSSGTADGRNGDHVLLAPPFIIDPPGIEALLEPLARSIESELRATPG